MKSWSLPSVPAACALVAVFTLVALVPAAGVAQEKPPAGPEDMAAMMAAREMAKPSAEHQRIAALAGTWDQTYKMYMTPGQEPLVAKGKSVNTMILGGRFLEFRIEGGEGEMRVEGLSVMGFDRRAGKYTLVGFDTWGTYYVTGAGDWDETAKAWKLPGEHTDPQTGRKESYTFVIRPESADRNVMEILFHLPDGQTLKAVEVTSTRRQ